MSEFSVYIQEIKDYAIEQLTTNIPGIFLTEEVPKKREKSLYFAKHFFAFYESFDRIAIRYEKE